MIVPFVLDFDDKMIEDLHIKENFDFYQSKGVNQFKDIRKSIEDNYLGAFSDKEINGTRLQNDWFPDLSDCTVDVFLSHSHGDIEKVEAFSGWLKEELSLCSFIDADVWMNIESLEKKINRIANQPRKRNGITLYDYNNSRLMFQHTNAMLSVALQKMMDKAEIVIFLASSNSVKCYEKDKITEITKITKTFSPWIYSELSCMKIIRRKKIWEYREEISLLEEQMIKKASVPISYIVDYDSMERLSTNDLISLQRRANELKKNEVNGKDVLNFLYQRKCPKIWKEYESAKNNKGLIGW